MTEADYNTRKSIRLREYDYSSNGAYFVTICTHGKRCIFWDSYTPALNSAGTLILHWVQALHTKFPFVELDCCAVMPNHVHLVLLFHESRHSLSQVIQWFKTMSTNNYIHHVRTGDLPAFEKHLWQRSYYDHIIRNEDDLAEIRKYVLENPMKWHLDKLYLL